MRAARRTVLTLLSVAALAVTGCAGSGTDQTTAPPPASTSVAPSTSTSRPAATPAPTTGAPGRRQWTTTAKAGTNQPRVPAHMPMLVAIRTGSHDGYDRVVLEFENDLPSWQVRYVRQVTSESGAQVPLKGRAFLFVQVNPAWGHDQDTPPYRATYTGPRTLTPSYPTLLQVTWVDEFEGYLTFGLGLSRRVGFRVLELRRPSRLAIDVAH
jgi:hypothetical protein